MVGPVIVESLWNQYWLEVWRREAEAVIIPGAEHLVNMPYMPLNMRLSWMQHPPGDSPIYC